MKKASKKTAKKATKKKPVSFDDVVDSAPGQVVPVSQAKAFEILDADTDVSEDFTPSPVYHQLGTEPMDEEREWEKADSIEQALGIEASESHVAGEVPPDAQNDLTGRFSAPETASKEGDAEEPPRVSQEEVDSEDLNISISETIQVFSSLMEAFQWLYRKTKKRVRLLPEEDGKLHRRWAKAEAHMEKLKKIQ